MTLSGNRTFVGFGLGPIQTGLFLHEAFSSGEFGRLVAAEVDAGLVRAVRAGGGLCAVNIAHAGGIETSRIGPVEILDPAVDEDRRRIIEAIREADEIATAVPSVRFYRGDGAGSIHRLLARGIEGRAGRPGLLYAAENHNEAAEILLAAVGEEIAGKGRADALAAVSFLNTVIGKMSGVVSDPEEIRRRGLAPLVPGGAKAHLVEEYSRILISRPRGGGASYHRGIRIFEEKEHLVPFEEAKLYGHNAAHALAGYTGALHGLEQMHELRSHPRLLGDVRAAFIEESGAALIRKHAGVDPLFTPRGYEEYADDLLRRMLNPHLGDRIERVARDPERKLGWDDRLVGTMRLALGQGIRPSRFARGAAAALVYLLGGRRPDRREAERTLREIWGPAGAGAADASAIAGLVARGLEELPE
ncbi:MAG: hypothetical protein JXA90_02740 [Planctomycetes bacterium]|nr:hypothetical protein [Planctomycetota bacterium]